MDKMIKLNFVILEQSSKDLNYNERESMREGERERKREGERERGRVEEKEIENQR